MAQATVAIVGAGPAGLYAAQKLAKSGVRVVILNRDIKPGGLAEFGIYPNKYKMKRGLRKVFAKILADPAITYFGNVKIGAGQSISLHDLRDMGFAAVVVAVGAQGTNWLGLPGEDSSSVLHAKDLVYHYNGLPPYSERDFSIGQNVCVVGIGNVCLDIVHWLICERKVASVVAVARRGPAERAYTDKEMKLVSGALDVERIRQDFAGNREALEAVGQDPDVLFAELTAFADTPLETESNTAFWIRFLRGPKAIEVENGKVIGLLCDVNRLTPGAKKMGVEGTGLQERIPCDTVVFAIGDKIEPQIGLPLDASQKTFAVCPEPWEEFPDRPRYMVYDPEEEKPMYGFFVVGWARRASDGLVGLARADSVRGCDEILAYLNDDLGESPTIGADPLILLRKRLQSGEFEYVDYDGVRRLIAREAQRAEELGLEEFKFRTTQTMLDVIRGEE